MGAEARSTGGSVVLSHESPSDCVRLGIHKEAAWAGFLAGGLVACNLVAQTSSLDQSAAYGLGFVPECV